MLGKRSRPVIGKLPDMAIPDLITSPKSPLDFKVRSPRSNNGFKTCVAGVGLGIVAALEKSSGDHADCQTPAKLVLGSLNLNRSEPIPIGTANRPSSSSKSKKSDDDESYEDYTCVISHRGPNNKPITRVFFDEDKFSGDCGRWKFYGDGYGSPPVVEEVAPAYPTSSFLSSCYLCRKTLHGRDIFMYRGEKAFCSSECRYKQIVSDERKEKCRSEASISTAGDLSASPYSGGQLFSTGIIAA